ncbi:MAG TPA: hypothetical protein VFZ15_06775, partial [Acidimicrobiia bacterium]|nr:hypothetical protein [Acidimicrobiia bacterium]
MTTATARTLRLGTAAYPLVLPSVRDPRLHLAAVIISIHILGQTVLGFRVSVPQILAAILICAAIEVAWVFHKTRSIVWPASAMLTGSGVALILRLVGAERGDHWSWSGWYFFAGIAAFSLMTKYLIRVRGTHVFNPSNFGLVVAFLVLGSGVIEPLDFWWFPFGPWMTAAYLIILVGGILITSRLRLLAMASAFWMALAAGIGVLAASGHCMTTAWAVQPVCGSRFWWIIVTSPEVLIFLFFMITDPKTIPEGRSARVVFAVCLALTCALLIAPQTTEFGAKVGLLAGLVVLTPLRYLFDRFLTSNQPVEELVSAARGPWRVFAGGAMLGSFVVLVAVAIVAAGAPARDTAQAAGLEAPVIAVEVDPSTLPAVSVSPDVTALNAEISGGPQGLALMLAENLIIDGEAMLQGDTSQLRAADDGERLVEMERRVEVAATTGELLVSEYEFDALHLDVVFTEDSQDGASLALVASGSVDEIEHDAEG